jgi:hypothetical protein
MYSFAVLLNRQASYKRFQVSSRGTTITGASVPARIRAAVDPRKIRRGAANRLEPTNTTNTSVSCQLSFFSADSNVNPSATSNSISGASGNDVAEGGGEAVGRCDGRKADDHVADQADGTRLQALVADSGSLGFRDCHVREYTVRVVTP